MLLDNLKARTSAQHSNLERINGLPASRADYVTLLRRFHGFIAPWETCLAELLPAHDPLRAGREKTAWLEQDLASFGFGPADLAALPRCDAAGLPDTASRAHLLGACYVLEGSTLGGQFIARHLERHLGLPPGAGDRFFRSYGAEVGAKWQAFRAHLLAHSSPEADAIIIRSAQATFDKLAAWFQRPVEVAA